MCLLLPYIEPQLFKVSSFIILDKVYLLLKAGGFVVILFLYLTNSKMRVSKELVLLTAVQISTFIGTYLNDGDYTRYLGPAISCISVVMITELGMSYNLRGFLRYLENVLIGYLILHLCTFIPRVLGIYPFVTQTVTFLGIENRWIYVLLPLIIICSINSYFDNDKLTIKALLVCCFSIFSLIYVWSVGAMIACVAFISVLLIKPMLKKIGLINMKMISILYLVINYLLVTETILKKFSNVFKIYLKKDVTLSGRIHLWREVIQTLNEKPYFGGGVLTAVEEMRNFYIKSGFVPGCAVNHPHNHLLYVAYSGGYVSLIFFILFIAVSCCKIDEISNKKIQGVLVAGMVSIFTAALVDTLDYSLFYIIVLIPFYMFKTSKINYTIKIFRLKGVYVNG